MSACPSPPYSCSPANPPCTSRRSSHSSQGNGSMNDRIEVEAVPGTPHYVIRNGRHRFLAALIAGHTHVLATLEPSTQETP